jgi:UDP-N-acetylglucosamine diphosphorylase/glucosamine-1-phosphate N-acetyltransferase
LSMNKGAAIILAAGKGTRMKSERAKVLHAIAGIPMIRYVVETALSVIDDVVVVIGHQAAAVRDALAPYGNLYFALQEEQLGTGHAVLTALPVLPKQMTHVVILCGDTPLIRPTTLDRLLRTHKSRSRPLTVLTTVLDNPSGYGRIVLNSEGNVVGIVEEADASEQEKKITMVNTGAYCIDTGFLRKCLPELTSDNAQGEFYLTDVVARSHQEGVCATVVAADNPFEVLGVNTLEDLATVEKLIIQGKTGKESLFRRPEKR